MSVRIRYSEAFKQQVLRELEQGEFGSVQAAARAYGIRGGSTIQTWTRRYGRSHLLRADGNAGERGGQPPKELDTQRHVYLDRFYYAAVEAEADECAQQLAQLAREAKGKLCVDADGRRWTVGRSTGASSSPKCSSLTTTPKLASMP